MSVQSYKLWVLFVFSLQAECPQQRRGDKWQQLPRSSCSLGFCLKVSTEFCDFHNIGRNRHWNIGTWYLHPKFTNLSTKDRTGYFKNLCYLGQAVARLGERDGRGQQQRGRQRHRHGARQLRGGRGGGGARAEAGRHPVRAGLYIFEGVKPVPDMCKWC